MNRIVEAYFQLLKVAIVACLALMVALVFANVVLRYAFNMGITTSEEVSRFLFVWMIFLGAIVALRENGHLGVDLVIKNLPIMGRRVCFVAAHLLMLYATWLILQGSWEQTLINWDVASPASGLSMGLLYGVGIVFGVSAGVILLVQVFRALTGRIGEAELMMAGGSAEAEELPTITPPPDRPAPGEERPR